MGDGFVLWMGVVVVIEIRREEGDDLMSILVSHWCATLGTLSNKVKEKLVIQTY